MRTPKDWTGQKFNQLTLIKPIGKRYGKIVWEALCDCGALTQVNPYEAAIGHKKSCGGSKHRFVALTSLECEWCDKQFSMKTGNYNAMINQGRRRKFCSKQCEHAARKQNLYIRCDMCGISYLTTEYKLHLNDKHYCSRACKDRARKKELVKVDCVNCHKPFFLLPGVLNARQKSNKKNNLFCTSACAAIHRSQHSHPRGRSKLEFWLEDKLSQIFPDLNVIYNGRKHCGSELDIHLPDFDLAFEINGIHHYKPIYGKDKLMNVKLRDKKKQLRCFELGTILHTINTNNFGLKDYNHKEAEKYLRQIVSKIKEHMHVNNTQ